MFRHPSEPLEPHVRRVVHTNLHPGGSCGCHGPVHAVKCNNWIDFLTFCWIWCAFVAVCVFVWCCRSRYWTSRTPTARPTVRPHSSTRRTRGSTRRGLRPLWSRVGWMSERLRPPNPTLLHSIAPPPPTPVHRALIFTSLRRRRRRRQKTKWSNFIRRTQVPPWKKEEWNNQTTVDI